MDGAETGGDTNDDVRTVSAETSAGTGGRDRSQEVTERLLDAAVDVFAETGFDAARVAEIARRAGLTTGAIYARWRGKRALLTHAVDHLCSQVLGLSEVADGTPAADALAALVGRHFDNDDARSRDVMLEALVSARRDHGFRAAVSRTMDREAGRLGEIVSAAKAEGSIDADLSTVAIVSFFQAVRLGMHLVASASDVPVPREHWEELIARQVAALGPAVSAGPSRPEV